MKKSDTVTLILLSALWGGSYVFLRLSAGEFGAFALAAIRALGAAAILVPLLVVTGGLPALRRHWKPIAIVGLTNCALPFVLYSYAAEAIPAGLSALFSATTPLFAAAIGWLWLGDKLSRARLLGLPLGFAGVLLMARATNGGQAAGAATGWAIGACLLATLAYGLSANLTKRYLHGVPPLAVAAGGQLATALVLVGPAVHLWPTTPPSLRGWLAVAALAIGSTAVAYVLFFRLIARVGPARGMTIGFLIPAFGTLWGALFLGEAVTAKMVLGGAVILAGTGLTTGALDPRLPALSRTRAPRLA